MLASSWELTIAIAPTLAWRRGRLARALEAVLGGAVGVRATAIGVLRHAPPGLVGTRAVRVARAGEDPRAHLVRAALVVTEASVDEHAFALRVHARPTLTLGVH